MNSLEALKLLSECANGENKLVFSACLDLEQNIKQDLEKLELIEALYNKTLKEMETIKNDDRELYLKFKQLEKENEQLKQQRDSLAINNGELVVKVTDLQKENKELIINKNVAQAVALNQKREIAELKDQISYLKEDGEEWQSAYEWSQAQNSILKLKNQELEEENQKLKKDYNLLDTTMESDDRIINSLLKEKEQLQNDIKLNEAQIDDLTLEVANYKHALEEKNEIIMDLKEKNQELKTTLLEYKAQENLYWNTATNNVNLREENEKLKKAIEILSNYICVRNPLDEENTYYLSALFSNEEIDKQTHDLLKEVFKDE